jgi:outer membrane protein assembly factor BamB
LRARDRRVIVTIVACLVAIGFVASGLARVIHHGPPPPFRANRQSITTYHFANSRDGLDLGDPSFRNLGFDWSDETNLIDGAVYAEPLVWSGRIYVVTEADVVEALDAETGLVDWQVTVGTPVQAATVHAAPGVGPGCGTVFPLGITGTPVIDTAKNTLYLAEETQRRGTSGWQGVEHRLVAVGLTHGRVLWSRRIDPAGYGDGRHGTYLVPAEQQRAALTLANGRVYTEFGGLSGDCGTYHGFVVGVPTRGSGTMVVYRTPSPTEDAIWAPSGAAVDAAGDLFVATGNGSTRDPTFKMDNAVIELSPTLHVVSYFAPSDWSLRNGQDLDLGSAGPLLLPGGRLLFQAGKPGYASPQGGTRESFGYLLEVGRLGGLGRPLFRGFVCPGSESVFGANAAGTFTVNGHRTVLVFAACSGGTVALAVTTGRRPAFRRIWVASAGDPNGPPIIAGGLVWAVSTGADGAPGASGWLYGMSPITGTVLVTEQLDQPVNHFATPAAGDGQLVIPLTNGVEEYRPWPRTAAHP